MWRTMDAAWEVAFFLMLIRVPSCMPILFFVFIQIIRYLPGLSHHNSISHFTNNTHSLIKDS